MNFYIILCLLVVFGLAVWWLYLIASGLGNADDNNNDTDTKSGSSGSPAEREKQALRSGRAGKWARCLLSSICFWRNQEDR